jgi:hypothetical protein
MFEQCELRLFPTIKNAATSSPKVARRQRVEAKPRHWTTDEVVERLKLESPYQLRKSRANGSAYRSDRYVAVPAGRNRWELFQRCGA